MKMSKGFSLWITVIAFALAAASPVHADDFKGFYIGGNVGAANSNADARTSTVFSPTGYFASTSVPAIATAGIQNLSPSQAAGGFTGGFNLQYGKLVLGAESDIGSMNLSDSASATVTYPCCAPTSFTLKQTVKTTWLFTLRGRAGIAFGRVLLYGTGGLGWTDVRYSETFSDTFATAAELASINDNVIGWVAGGGAEFKASKHWSVKGEFLRLDFGSESTTSTNLTAFSPPIAFPTNVFTHSTTFNANAARFGVNFHF